MFTKPLMPVEAAIPSSAVQHIDDKITHYINTHPKPLRGIKGDIPIAICLIEAELSMEQTRLEAIEAVRDDRIKQHKREQVYFEYLLQHQVDICNTLNVECAKTLAAFELLDGQQQEQS